MASRWNFAVPCHMMNPCLHQNPQTTLGDFGLDIQRVDICLQVLLRRCELARSLMVEIIRIYGYLTNKHWNGMHQISTRIEKYNMFVVHSISVSLSISIYICICMHVYIYTIMCSIVPYIVHFALSETREPKHPNGFWTKHPKMNTWQWWTASPLWKILKVTISNLSKKVFIFTPEINHVND